jgi:hypothetical protein
MLTPEPPRSPDPRGLVMANGDFHRPEHLAGWKTLLPCEKDAEAVVAYLRSARPVYLTRVNDERALPVAA